MNQKDNCCSIKLHSSVKVWPKWQVVIPKDIREKLNISSGDELTVITKDDKHIGFVKNENINELIEYLQNEMGNS